MNANWPGYSHFAALDWASDHHDVAVVDCLGNVALEFRFERSASGWAEFQEKMRPFAGAPLALETSSGPAVDQLLQRGWTLYPVNPKSAERFRDRKAPSGSKSDRRDAWCLADALRTDGQSWPPLLPENEATATLRALCRDEMALIEQRTALVNQLQAALGEYYPTALEAFADWTSPAAWAFVKQFPTPEGLARAGKRRWEKFLHTHRLWRPETAQRRLALFALANALPASPAIVKAKSLLALTVVSMLQALEERLVEYRRQINRAFDEHPDRDIFGSLPGAAEKLAPRLLSALGSQRERFPDAESLLCLAGVSPVGYESGKVKFAHVRWACDSALRHTVHLWCDSSRKSCAWAAEYYARKREEGQGHAAALRCLGKRWLKIVYRLWIDRTTYDDAKHRKSMEKHGSWVHERLAARVSAV
jgi:transposase